MKAIHTHSPACFEPTSKLYCGYAQGAISNHGGYKKDESFAYQESGVMKDSSLALSGKFLAASEYIESQEAGAELIVHFHATEVNLVFGAQSAKTSVEIEFNGDVLTGENRGRDVSEKGELLITKQGSYNLLKGLVLSEGILRVRAKHGNFQTFAFTFLGCTQ